jgi:hypothetical protein
VGDECEEAGIPHVAMQKSVAESNRTGSVRSAQGMADIVPPRRETAYNEIKEQADMARMRAGSSAQGSPAPVVRNARRGRLEVDVFEKAAVRRASVDERIEQGWATLGRPSSLQRDPSAASCETGCARALERCAAASCEGAPAGLVAGAAAGSPPPPHRALASGAAAGRCAPAHADRVAALQPRT